MSRVLEVVVRWLILLAVLGKVHASLAEGCGYWTDWMDDEQGGIVDHLDTGEFEKIEEHRYTYDFCDYPTKIECRTVLEPYTSFENTGQSVYCDENAGLYCFHAEQFPFLCQNYEIRLFCPCVGDSVMVMYNDSAEDELCIGNDLFKIVTDVRLDPESADAYCHELYSPDGFEASLAIVEDYENIKTLRKYLRKTKSLAHPTKHGYWIGCGDVETEGTFLWANGQPLTYPDRAWSDRNPNNKTTKKCKTLDKDQDCCQLWEYPRDKPQFKLDDDCCSRKKQFICRVTGFCLAG